MPGIAGLVGVDGERARLQAGQRGVHGGYGEAASVDELGEAVYDTAEVVAGAVMDMHQLCPHVAGRKVQDNDGLVALGGEARPSVLSGDVLILERDQ